MISGRASTVLTALGLDRDQEQLYFRLAPVSGHTVEGVANLLQTGREELAQEACPLVELGLVRIDGERIVVPPLAEVVARLVQRESRVAATAAGRLDALALAVPHLVAAASRPDDEEYEEVHPLDGELSSGGNPLQLIGEMLRTTQGEMLWLRPDAWAMEREALVTKMLGEILATGRTSRAIYPVRAATEAPDALLARARLGEQIRVISDLPTRMFILGDAHAVLPEPIGYTDSPRVHVRQRAVVAALRFWFEALWERATPMPEFDLGEARPDLRRFLLEQLVAGATDAAVARTLGVSLRTVRRRIASMMEELGVDSRFQLGVEAARRGWI
ncbi:helix-turn-helix transcriptional regulator [Nocardioides coralli]|uniref:helix-turn-helix transcriptional regulator n=1 Tax=Nocardioides coralli TaxID=2872154 RepID=UPI001CA3C70B|nr:LuxR C-terminal-related transcriptional regulator [Nocardioides coralli]QZY28864.1 LuxR C-terminal-related transcriptional regulator [Nocardioides coralli]